MAEPLDLVFLQEEIDRFDAHIASLRSSGGLNRNTEKEAEEAFKEGNQGVSIGEARRAIKYQEDGPVDDTGGRFRQFAQGLTYGLGDELRGIGAAITPGGEGGVGLDAYRAAQQRSKAGVEQFRRENPYEAMGRETLGSVATLPLGGFAAGKAGLSATKLLAGGLTSGSKTVRGATQLGQAALGGLASPSRAVRSGATAVQGAASGGLLGQDYGETGTGAIVGGVLGGGLGASGLGTRVAANIHKRRGNLLAKEAPSELLRMLPKQIGRVPIRDPVRQFAEKRIVSAQPGEEMAQALSQQTGRSAVTGKEFAGEAELGTLSRPSIFGNDAILPVTGGGNTWLTRARTKIGQLLDRGKTQEGLLENAKDQARRTAYEPLDKLYETGAEITEDNIEQVLKVAGINIKDVLRAPVMVGSKITQPAVTRNTLANSLNARRTEGLKKLKDMVKQIGDNAQTRFLIKPREQRIIRSGLDAVTEIKKTPIGLGPREAEVVGEQINPRFVVEFLDSLSKGNIPSVRSLQAFRASLRREARVKDNNIAKAFESDLDKLLTRMFPGLDEADDMFRQAASYLDAHQLGTRKVTTLTFDELPKHLQGNALSPSKPGAPAALEEAVKWVRGKGKTTAEGDRLVANYLDGVFHKEIIEPLLKGREGGTEAGHQLWDLMSSESGKKYIQQFFGKGKNSEHHVQQALRMMDHILDLNITNPKRAEAVRRFKQWAAGIIAVSIGYKVLGGLLGGDDTESRPTY